MCHFLLKRLDEVALLVGWIALQEAKLMMKSKKILKIAAAIVIMIVLEVAVAVEVEVEVAIEIEDLNYYYYWSYEETLEKL